MIEVAAAIKHKYNRKAVAHIPCINLSKDDVLKMLAELDGQGIDEILALRGDRVPGVEPKKDFLHASDLISFIRKETGNKFKIYAACYPEGHTESTDFDKDIEYLKQKTE